MTAMADRVRRAKAAAGIAELLRRRHPEAWRGQPYETLLHTAYLLLDARLRLNRAGRLKWRNERRVRG